MLLTIFLRRSTVVSMSREVSSVCAVTQTLVEGLGPREDNSLTDATPMSLLAMTFCPSCTSLERSPFSRAMKTTSGDLLSRCIHGEKFRFSVAVA